MATYGIGLDQQTGEYTVIIDGTRTRTFPSCDAVVLQHHQCWWRPTAELHASPCARKVAPSEPVAAAVPLNAAKPRPVVAHRHPKEVLAGLRPVLGKAGGAEAGGDGMPVAEPRGGQDIPDALHVEPSPGQRRAHHHDGEQAALIPRHHVDARVCFRRISATARRFSSAATRPSSSSA